MASSDDKMRPVSAGNFKNMFLTDEQVNLYLNGSLGFSMECLLVSGTYSATVDSSGNVTVDRDQRITPSAKWAFPKTDAKGVQVVSVPDEYKPTGTSPVLQFWAYTDSGHVLLECSWDGTAFAVKNSVAVESGKVYSQLRLVAMTGTWKTGFGSAPVSGSEIMTIGQVKKFLK